MDDGFILKVDYNGKTYELESKFIRLGFIHQFHIHIEDRTLVFEFDEDREYRVMDASEGSSKSIDTGLIEAILHKISTLH